MIYSLKQFQASYRDGLLIDFRGGWFNGTVVTSNHNTFGEIQKRRLAVAD